MILEKPTVNRFFPCGLISRVPCSPRITAHPSCERFDSITPNPARTPPAATLDGLAAEVREGGGSAHVLHIEEPESANFIALFDRGDDFTALLAEVAQVRETLTAETVQDVLKKVRKLRKAFANLVEIDFFPGEAQRQTDTALCELELACARALSPDEPQAVDGVMERLELSDYQGRTWATRRRPWVDRLASAWLIRRFIDPQARILWLDSPDDCPPDALGFDFDGATFSHVGSRVTFEVLAASFGLEQAAIARLGLLVHCLDVGGIQPPEAVGIESVLAGLRETLTQSALNNPASRVSTGVRGDDR